MEKVETVWRFAVTSLSVWRLSRLLFKDRGSLKGADVAAEDPRGGSFWFDLVVDSTCWISVWLSSQTALWVMCGFAGVFFGWLSFSGMARLFVRAERQSDEISCLRRGDGMQAHHG